MFMIKKSAKDIFSLFSSSLTGQLIHVIALPFLSLYFGQVDIGAFLFLQAIITMGAIFL